MSVDPFDAVLSLEETLMAQGHGDGRAHGVTIGLQEGHELGATKGLQVGEEIGFYEGFLAVYEKRIAIPDNGLSERALKALERMRLLVSRFPKAAPLYPDLNEDLQLMRSKFKVLCSLLGAQLHTGATTLNF
eukprot:GILK01013517.1.p1 GENE.GILK01013517.1~~GILK01013517.1.p1  ORF type:complete len:132 (+),score=15.44 GILK01013517.1:35-430(+)